MTARDSLQAPVILRLWEAAPCCIPLASQRQLR